MKIYMISPTTLCSNQSKATGTR